MPVRQIRNLIAIDPGDVFCGVAFFERDSEEEYGWRCIDAIEYDPDAFNDSFAESLVDGDIDAVVYERWRLYGDKAQLQKGSEMLTSQQIGVIKWLVRNHNAHMQRHIDADQPGSGIILSCEQPGQPCNQPKNEFHTVALWGQLADIKKPTRGNLRGRGIKSVAKPIATKMYGGRDHVIDAELHGWKFILDTPEVFQDAMS